MTASAQIAKHLRQVFFGGNWTMSNLMDQLSDVSWEEAVTKVQSFNTIATLTWHIGYYLPAQIKVLNGGPLEAKDELSFAHPEIRSQEDWKKINDTIRTDAETLASLIEQVPDSLLYENFTDEKYGSYYRNFWGLIEHTHYHLGQIVILKRMLREK